jgi:hypothetical protein
MADVREWLARGHQPDADPLHAGFVVAVELAQGKGEAGLNVRVVQAAKAGDWRAAVALLERMHPERWARTTRQETPPVLRLDEAVVHLRRLLVRRTMRLIEATAEPSPAGTEDAAGVPER